MWKDFRKAEKNCLLSVNFRTVRFNSLSLRRRIVIGFHHHHQQWMTWVLFWKFFASLFFIVVLSYNLCFERFFFRWKKFIHFITSIWCLWNKKKYKESWYYRITIEPFSIEKLKKNTTLSSRGYIRLKIYWMNLSLSLSLADWIIE